MGGASSRCCSGDDAAPECTTVPRLPSPPLCPQSQSRSPAYHAAVFDDTLDLLSLQDSAELLSASWLKRSIDFNNTTIDNGLIPAHESATGSTPSPLSLPAQETELLASLQSSKEYSRPATGNSADWHAQLTRRQQTAHQLRAVLSESLLEGAQPIRHTDADIPALHARESQLMAHVERVTAENTRLLESNDIMAARIHEMEADNTLQHMEEQLRDLIEQRTSLRRTLQTQQQYNQVAERRIQSLEQQTKETKLELVDAQTRLGYEGDKCAEMAELLSTQEQSKAELEARCQRLQAKLALVVKSYNKKKVSWQSEKESLEVIIKSHSPGPSGQESGSAMSGNEVNGGLCQSRSFSHSALTTEQVC